MDALERAQRLGLRPGARHRIEHAGLMRPDQLPRFARLGVSAVVQPSFLRHFGDDYAAVMGAERVPWLYRGRAFLEHGIPSWVAPTAPSRTDPRCGPSSSWWGGPPGRAR
ncbi:amidohydrolase family protein [Streptomyces niveus]